jgi:hypothetical protein
MLSLKALFSASLLPYFNYQVFSFCPYETGMYQFSAAGSILVLEDILSGKRRNV